MSADLQLRIHVNRQLTVQESRHKLARDMCHGKRGTIHHAYRDGMEDQLGALGLVLNAIMLRTTKYIDAAVTQLRAEGHEPREEDIARRSPLKHRSLNLLGRYSFTASVPAPCARCATRRGRKWTRTTTRHNSGGGGA
nr:transposase [Streptomyces liliiviolaceus]